MRRTIPGLIGLVGTLLVLASTATAQEVGHTKPNATAPTTTSASLLDVGSRAPSIRASAWLNGKPVVIAEPGQPPVYIVVFWASWSGPSQAALADVVRTCEQFGNRGVSVVAVTAEPVEAVRAFLTGFSPKVPFPIAIDEGGASTRAWCESAGVNFVPYAFVVGPDRTIAWHGHPQQPELAAIVEQLLTGKYDAAKARELVRRSRSAGQLEALFRDAYERESWRTALLALDALLATDAPKERLLRYKLSILLGELDQREQAQALVADLLKNYADNARFLNSAAWDVLSQTQLQRRDPQIGFQLARAAYRASHGRDASITDTYACALHLIGRVDLAVEVEKRAVSAAQPEQKERFERTLAFYQACAATQKDATADPD